MAMVAATLGFVSFPGANTVLAKSRTPCAISCRGVGGVDDKARKVNFYRILSLESEKASAEEIKRAYRSLARRLHPDVCPPERKEESTRALVELNRAYEALSDPVLRRHHDADLEVPDSRGSTARRGARRELMTWEWQLYELGRRSALRMQQRARGAAMAC